MDKVSYFKENIKLLRIKKGLKQNEMLTAIGIKQSTWNGYETGNSTPYLSVAIEISKYFDISIGDLIEKDLSVYLGEGNNFNNLEETKSHVKRNKIGNKIGNNLVKYKAENIDLTKAAEECKQCVYKDSTIKIQAETISALRGQVDSLKLNVDMLLNNQTAVKKQAG